MGFPRQEYWSGLPVPPPGDLADPAIEPTTLMSPILAGGIFTTSATWKALIGAYIFQVFLRGKCKGQLRLSLDILQPCL